MRKRDVGLVAGLALLLVIIVPLGACFGDVKIPVSQVWEALFNRTSSLNGEIVWEYRLPRILVGMFVGANLAVSGALLQAVTQNPLAAPNVIGMTAGASLFAVLALLIIPHFPASGLPFATFFGALFAGLCVYAFAWKKGMDKGRFALSGIAFDALFQAAVTGILVFATKGIDAAVIWLAGSLWGRTWEHVALIVPWSVLGLALAYLCYRRLNVLQLHDDVAASLGMRVQAARFLIFLIAVGLCGSAVAVSGPIGFVGLVIPHLARLLTRADYQRLIPVSALLGAMLMIGADTVGRTIAAPIEIPVGILTAFIGAPYFLFLLRRAKLS